MRSLGGVRPDALIQCHTCTRNDQTDIFHPAQSSWMTILASSTTFGGSSNSAVADIGILGPTFAAPSLPSLSSSSSPGRLNTTPTPPPANFRFSAPTSADPSFPSSPFRPCFRFCLFARFLAVFTSARASRSACRALKATCSSNYSRISSVKLDQR